MPTFSAYIRSLVISATILVAGGGLYLYSGFYPIGADVPHNRVTYWLLEAVRERSIARAASGIEVPLDLNDSARLLAGGADYNDMCAGCHLSPGKTQSDFTLGLYPAPPNLTLSELHEPAGDNGDELTKRQFWIIKHGIKASGMPAWAPGHDDERIWNMVSFLQRLPDLSPTQYQIITARKQAAENH